MTIQLNSDNSAGTASLRVTQTEIAFSGDCGPAPGESFSLENLVVSGGPSTLTLTAASQTPGGQTTRLTFTGALSGNTISGPLSMDIQANATRPNEPTGTGATTFQVALQKS